MKQEPLCLFCKSFRDDLDRFAVLLESIERHNVEHLPFVVSVPTADRSLFLDRFGTGRFEILTDEALRPKRKLENTWADQQVVKLSFWKVGRAAATLVVDSDHYFLRDFGRGDFLAPDGEPLLVVSTVPHVWEEGDPGVRGALLGTNELPALSVAEIRTYAEATRWPEPRSLFARFRKLAVGERLENWLGRPGRHLRFMPGPVLSHRSQELFFREYLKPSGLDYADLINAHPWEYRWLGEWQLARPCHELRPIPSPFFCFTSDEGIAEARALGITAADVARHYVGIALAARHQSILRY